MAFVIRLSQIFSFYSEINVNFIIHNESFNEKISVFLYRRVFASGYKTNTYRKTSHEMQIYTIQLISSPENSELFNEGLKYTFCLNWDGQ